MSDDPNRRSTSNANSRGSAEQRRRRGQWLVQEFRADVSIIEVRLALDPAITSRVYPTDIGHQMQLERVMRAHVPSLYSQVLVIPACRCYRCGKLVCAREVSPDRWPILGCDGGTYARGNIRPACLPCNVITGSEVGHARKAAKRASGRVRSKRT